MIFLKIKKIAILCLCILLSNNARIFYLATCADTEHYFFLFSLIESIHKYHAQDSWHLLVFDIGLEQEERDEIANIKNVTVMTPNLINKDMLTKYTVRSWGRVARGYYTWKPVALKMALDYYPYCLFIDAGLIICSPLNYTFDCIERDGYFHISCSHSINLMAPSILVKTFEPDFKIFGETEGLGTGYFGVSRKIFNSYILPVYNLAKNIIFFRNDAQCSGGFNYCRHEQAIFSIFARKLGHKIHQSGSVPLIRIKTCAGAEIMCAEKSKMLINSGLIRPHKIFYKKTAAMFFDESLGHGTKNFEQLQQNCDCFYNQLIDGESFYSTLSVYEMLKGIFCLESSKTSTERIQNHGPFTDFKNNIPFKITPIIHQIRFESTATGKEAELARYAQNQNPNFIYKLWTDKEIKELHLNNIKIVQSAINKADKINLIKYEILYQYGGIFLDTNIKLVNSFDHLIKTYNFFAGLSPLDCNKFAISNSVLGATKNNSFLKYLIETIPHYWSKLDKIQNTYKTGPVRLTDLLLTRALYDYGNQIIPGTLTGTIIFPPSYFYASHVRPESLTICC